MKTGPPLFSFLLILSLLLPGLAFAQSAEKPLTKAETSGFTATSRQAELLVIYFQANIHAGEVEGKEATLMLARDLALGEASRFMDKLVVLIVPGFNPDGNERISPCNRRDQAGPEQGVGV